MTDKPLNFEESVNRLSDISEKLKSGALTLEESAQAYKEGVEYYNLCKEILKNARQKIEIYNPDNHTLEDFEK